MPDEGFHPIAVAEFAGNSPKTIYKRLLPKNISANSFFEALFSKCTQ
jgi:hypothetical protein